jgi:hypothetical protein|nr:MAG TPA: hypothetical protein [Caudoviricetes sp.]
MTTATYDNIDFIVDDFDFNDFYNYIEKSVKNSDYLSWDNLHDYFNSTLSGYILQKYNIDIEESTEMDNSFWQVGNDLDIWNYNHYHYLVLLVLEHSRQYNEQYWYGLLNLIIGISEYY